MKHFKILFSLLFMGLAMSGNSQEFSVDSTGVAIASTIIVDQLVINNDSEPTTRQNVTTQSIIHAAAVVNGDGSMTDVLNVDENLTSIGASDIWIEFDRKYPWGVIPRCHATAIDQHAIAKIDAAFNRVRVSFVDRFGNVVFPKFSFTCN